MTTTVGHGFGRGAGALFHMSRLLGLAPFRLTRTSAVRSRGWELYSLFFGVLAVVVMSSVCHMMYRSMSGDFYLDLLQLVILAKGLCACCLLVVNLLRRGAILRALNSILLSERQEQLATEANQAVRQSSLGLSLLVAIQMLGLITVVIWTLVNMWSFLMTLSPFNQVFCLISSYLPVLFIFTTDMQFGNQALVVHRQLSHLTGSMRVLLDAAHAAHSVPAGLAASRIARATRQFRIRQHTIYSSICRLNSAYSIQLLLSVTLGLMETTCGLYFIISSEIASWKPLLCAWNVFYVTKLALLMTPCQWVETKGDQIADSVNNALLIQNLPKSARDELKEFQVQTVHLKMRFSAAGVFPLDYSQLQKVLSTIVTYFVILLQMQGRGTGTNTNNWTVEAAD